LQAEKAIARIRRPIKEYLQSWILDSSLFAAIGNFDLARVGSPEKMEVFVAKKIP